MLVKKKAKIKSVKSNLRGGEGDAVFEAFLPDDRLPAHYRLFSEIVLEPGCSIGKHTHVEESEIYYILSGEAVLDDNGTERKMEAGDFSVCYSGEYHAVKNCGGGPLRFLGCIVKND